LTEAWRRGYTNVFAIKKGGESVHRNGGKDRRARTTKKQLTCSDITKKRGLALQNETSRARSKKEGSAH